jgi:hypothetical protein
MKRTPVTTPLNGTTQSPVSKGAMLNVLQAAALLGTNERWVRRRMSCGLLPYRKLSGRVVFLRSELNKFIADLADLPGCTLSEAQSNLALRNGEVVRR